MSSQNYFQSDIWDVHVENKLQKLYQNRLLFYLKNSVVFNPAHPKTPSLFKFLSREYQKDLFEWHWLISHRDLIDRIPYYFRKMIIRSELAMNESRGRPEGVPNMPLTLKRQLQSGSLREFWIYIESLQQYDTLDSRLIRSFCDLVLAITERLQLNQWINENKKWNQLIQSLNLKTRFLSKHAILSLIKPISYSEFKETIEFRIRHSRISLMARAAFKALNMYWVGLFKLREKELVINQVPTLLDRNRLFELYVFFDEVENYLKEGWIPSKHDIFITKKHPLIVLEQGEKMVEIYYQTSKFFTPITKRLLESFKLGSSSIFDIVVLESKKNENFLNMVKIIEVKRSSKQNYLRTGLEQLFFYCNNFIHPKIYKNSIITGKLVCWDFDSLTLPSEIKSLNDFSFIFESFLKKHQRDLI